MKNLIKKYLMYLEENSESVSETEDTETIKGKIDKNLKYLKWIRKGTDYFTKDFVRNGLILVGSIFKLNDKERILRDIPEQNKSKVAPLLRKGKYTVSFVINAKTLGLLDLNDIVKIIDDTKNKIKINNIGNIILYLKNLYNIYPDIIQHYRSTYKMYGFKMSGSDRVIIMSLGSESQETV